MQLVKPSQILQLQRAAMYILGHLLGCPSLQNCWLHTERWILRHQQTTAHGQIVAWGIDHESAAAIKPSAFPWNGQHDI